MLCLAMIRRWTLRTPGDPALDAGAVGHGTVLGDGAGGGEGMGRTTVAVGGADDAALVGPVAVGA